MRPKSIREIIYEKTHEPSGKTKYDVQLYLTKRRKNWQKTVKRLWNQYKALKFDIRVVARLQKRERDDKYIYASPCFRSRVQVILSEGEIEEGLDTTIASVLDAYDVYMKKGSGWVLQRIESSQLNVYQYSTMTGGGGRVASMRAELLPTFLVNKNHSLLTFPDTSDKKCFLHCVLAALYPVTGQRYKRTDPQTYMQHEHTLKMENLKFPVGLDQIPTFERDNGLAINVLTVDEENQTPYYLQRSNNPDHRCKIDLLLFNEHYSLITSWSCFAKDPTHKRVPCTDCGRVFLQRGSGDRCRFCLSKAKGSTVVFPERGTKQKFCNQKNVCMNPFVYYCDLETIVSPCHNANGDDNKTIKTKVHKAIAIGLLRICTVKKYSHKTPIILTGEDCIEKFYETLKEEMKCMDEILQSASFPLDMSPEQERHHDQATSCYVCRESLSPSEKLRDHNHLKEKCNYLGPICNGCNLNRTNLQKNHVPILFHGSSRFDSKFLIQKLHKTDQSVTHVIAKTGENIMSMNLFNNRYVVLDSLNHLQSSLSSLVEVMKKSGKPLRITQRCWENEPGALELLSRKGVFPYSYLTGESVLTETTRLPPKEDFYNELTERDIEDEDYAHAERVWNRFKCQNLMEYMILYLQSDITLLADVFENYRNFFAQEFQLDSTRYLSLPGLSYDCMLRRTGCKLDFLYDRDTYDFVKRGLRGGVAMIPHRFARANNPMLTDFDPTQPISHLVYLDCNALYSSIMTKKLPYKKLRWVDDLEELENKIKSYTPNDKMGYLIECDLSYPTEIHDLTRDLPLAPEHRSVTKDMLSPYACDLMQRLEITMDKAPKLLSTQYDRSHYVCHIENLQFYLERGMKLTKIHRALSFRQKAVFEPYVRFCIEKRNQTGVSADERSLYKLLANAVFGRTILNVEKKNSVKLLTNAAAVSRSISNPRFKHADLINEHVVQICSAPHRTTIKTPYYIGIVILELSKLHMMRLHYEHFVKKFGRFRLRLCMTDTDSLLYHIQTDDLHRDLKELGVVEFGNYPPEHPYHDKSHAGELFYLKDESAGVPLKSFVGLRAKSYSLEYETDKLNKVVGKGIPKPKLRDITHEDMMRVLHDNVTTEVQSHHLRSYKHNMYSIRQTKLALSPLDTKRYMCADGISTLPHGHVDAMCEPCRKRKSSDEASSGNKRSRQS